MTGRKENESAAKGTTGRGYSQAYDPELKGSDGTLYDREFWDIGRHALIAGAAIPLLTSKARSATDAILAPLAGISLAGVAGWADIVKHQNKARPTDDAETVAFLADVRNKESGTWHYVDIPLNATKYSRQKYPTFTRDDDVVQMIGESVKVLMGTSNRFSKLNALRLVTHLVGDIHQPLHVGCCYLGTTSAGKVKLVRDPAVAAQQGLQSDHGGNFLLLPIGATGIKLHAYWDSHMDMADGGGGGDGVAVEVDPGGLEDASEEAHAPAIDPALSARFIAKLSDMIAQDPLAQAHNPGEGVAADVTPLDQWAVQWATNSLILARSAYKSVKIKGPHGNKGLFDVTWEGQAAYDARCALIVQSQLKLATQNLAALLNAIWP